MRCEAKRRGRSPLESSHDAPGPKRNNDETEEDESKRQPKARQENQSVTDELYHVPFTAVIFLNGAMRCEATKRLGRH